MGKNYVHDHVGGCSGRSINDPAHVGLLGGAYRARNHVVWNDAHSAPFQLSATAIFTNPNHPTEGDRDAEKIHRDETSQISSNIVSE
jgi:hypothetical protein